jgi:hypothetical protein
MSEATKAGISMRCAAFGVALTMAMTMLAWDSGFAQQAQTQEAAPSAAKPPETVIVHPSSALKPFDMKQCYEDDRGCQLATCVSVLTRDGTVIYCQSHSNYFP